MDSVPLIPRQVPQVSPGPEWARVTWTGGAVGGEEKEGPTMDAAGFAGP